MKFSKHLFSVIAVLAMVGSDIWAQPAAPKIMGITASRQLTIQSTVGTTNVIHYTEDLATNRWLILTNIVVTNSLYLFADQSGPPSPQRFYQVQVLGSGAITNTNTVLDLTNGLVGYWPFNEGSGTNTADASGNGTTGTLAAGASWTNGIAGDAIAFDGTNGNVFNNSPSSKLGGMAQLSVSCWFKIATNKNFQVIGPTGLSGYLIYTEASGFIHFYITTASGASDIRSTTATPTLGVWNHIVFTRSGPVVSGYLNGSPMALGSGTGSTTGNVVPISNFMVGYNGGIASAHLDGLVDELRIYNRVLTASEAKFLYTNPSGQ